MVITCLRWFNETKTVFPVQVSFRVVIEANLVCRSGQLLTKSTYESRKLRIPQAKVVEILVRIIHVMQAGDCKKRSESAMILPD